MGTLPKYVKCNSSRVFSEGLGHREYKPASKLGSLCRSEGSFCEEFLDLLLELQDPGRFIAHDQ